MKKIDELRRDGNLDKTLLSARKELMEVKSELASGGSVDNPGKVRVLKRKIARILTIQKEQEISNKS